MNYNKIKKYLRPIRRFLDEDVFDRVRCRLIEKNRILHEQNYAYLFEKEGTILFNNQYHWHYSSVDYMVAASLKYRGYDPVLFCCDGLPYCEYDTVSSRRPSCNHCYRSTKRHVDAFGLNSFKISDFVDNSIHKVCEQIAYETPINKLQNLEHSGVNIGEFARRNFLHYYKGIFEPCGEKEKIFRKCIHSALILSSATIAINKKIKIDKIITPNGKFIQSGISIQVAKNLDIPYYTWDVFTQYAAATFAKNEISHNQKIDDVWAVIKNDELTMNQSNDLNEYFNLQSLSKNTPYQYYDTSVLNDSNKILKKLNINNSKKIISIFPNVEWDSTAMGLNSAYESMQDWVFSMIEYSKNNLHFELIIRAHPGELKVPHDLKTATPICDVVREKIRALPSNVHLIGPHDNISSYALAEMSNIVMVYTSTLGIEFALSGIKPWVAASPYYSGKGFTVDLLNHAHAEKLLNSSEINKKMTSDEVKLARKLAYAVKFRRSFTFPLLNGAGKFSPESYKAILPNNNAVLDNICNFIGDKRNYLDLGPLYFS